MTDPRVTVLIPARDEEEHIVVCLDSVLAQRYPAEHLDIVVVDGGSTDRTAALARERLRGTSVRWIVLRGNGPTPANLNAGLARAAGEVVCRVDARSRIPPDYVGRCVELLGDPAIAVVGGAQVAVPPRPDALGRGIARALNNRFSMGLSRYRRAGRSGPADTVYLGAFRTCELRRVGGWDERFPTNQDYELNRRMSRDGLIWFDDRLRVDYVPRRSIGQLFWQYHRFGRWKVRFWRVTDQRPAPRQWLLLAVPGLGLASAVAAVRRPSLGLAIFGAALGAEIWGSTGPRSEPRGHLVALGATASVSLGWLSGVARELAWPR